jgi:hypothetical protein
MTKQSVVETIDFDNLPSISKAELPQAYSNAKRALALCERVDECHDWADKAKAMASYAKQSKDMSLYKMAVRIQNRATRRCGELLMAIPAANGARTDLEPHTAAGTRSDAAAEAGLSKRQKDTVLQVAAVPEESFEAQNESENPPTVTKLAAQGTKKKPIDFEKLKIEPENFKRATQVLGRITELANLLSENDASEIAAGVLKHEIPSAREHVVIIDRWFDRFIPLLGD